MIQPATCAGQEYPPLQRATFSPSTRTIGLTTDRTVGRHLPGNLFTAAERDHRPHYLGDDIAGPSNDHLVADPDVLASEFIGVVERGIGDHGAADLHRLQNSYRGSRPGPTDLHLDLARASVTCSSGGNLKAIAQRGAWEV